MDLNEEKIHEKINLGKPITIKFYENTKKILDFVESMILQVLEHYSRTDLKDVIIFCIKELITNAISANIKTLFFEKNKLNINNLGDYVNGLTRFKYIIEKQGLQAFVEELYALDLWVKFIISHSTDGMKFEITNNTPIVDIEEKKIRLKLQKSNIYVDLLEYHSQGEYDPDDERLGLTLITILMNKVKLDTSLFRIGTKDGITLSRIEVPLTEKYVSERKKFKKPQK